MRIVPADTDEVNAARIAILALAAVSTLGACGQDTEKKSGVVKPAAAASSTTATAPAVPSTTAGPTTTTTAKPAAPTTTTAKAATTSTTARPVTTTTTTTAASNVSYANCSAAKAAGAAPLYRGDPGYASKLDRDGDGIACES